MARPSAPGLVVVGVPKEKFSFLFSLPKDVYANHSEMTVGQSTVTLENGATLPSWLQFNPATMSFIATSVPAQGIPIRVAVHIGGERVIVLISRL